MRVSSALAVERGSVTNLSAKSKFCIWTAGNHPQTKSQTQITSSFPLWYTYLVSCIFSLYFTYMKHITGNHKSQETALGNGNMARKSLWSLYFQSVKANLHFIHNHYTFSNFDQFATFYSFAYGNFWTFWICMKVLHDLREIVLKIYLCD